MKEIIINSVKHIFHFILGMFLLLLTLMGNEIVLLANIEPPQLELDTVLTIKVVTDSIVKDSTIKDIKIPRIINLKPVFSTQIDTGNINYTEAEWFPYKGFKYDLKALEWTDRDVILFTNILFRESGSTVISKNHEIDQYFVAISAIRRYVDENLDSPVVIVRYNKSFTRFKNVAIKTTEDSYYVPRFVGAFSMASYEVPAFKRNKEANMKAWLQCHKVVLNVLKGEIPSHVPYIPHGTFAYLKKSIDTDYAWINAVTKKWCNVATTIKDHHYYANPVHMTAQEREHLQNNPFNPIKDFNEGLFADNRRENSLK